MTAEGGDVKLCAQEALAVQVGTGIDQELGDTGLSGAAPACSGPLAPASQTQDRDNIKIAQRGGIQQYLQAVVLLQSCVCFGESEKVIGIDSSAR